MPAEKHLAARSAVEKDNCRMLAGATLGKKQLSVDRHPVRSGEDHLLGCHLFARRKIGWDGIRSKVSRRSVSDFDCGAADLVRARTEKGDRAIAGVLRIPLDAFGNLPSTGCGAPPATQTRQMWRRSTSSWLEEKSNSRRSSRSETCSISKSPPGVSSLAGPPSADTEYRRLATLFPGEHDAIALCPVKLIGGNHGVMHASGAFVGPPHFAILAGRHIGDANRPRRHRLAARPRATGQRYSGRADERHAVAVGAPSRTRVVVSRWSQKLERFIPGFVHAYEGMIATAALERKQIAVRRPARRLLKFPWGVRPAGFSPSTVATRYGCRE